MYGTILDGFIFPMMFFFKRMIKHWDFVKSVVYSSKATKVCSALFSYATRPFWQANLINKNYLTIILKIISPDLNKYIPEVKLFEKISVIPL